MSSEIHGLKRRGSFIAKAVAEGGGGGEGFMDGVEASAGSNRRRCVCGCGLPADTLIPANVIIDQGHLKRFFYKLVSDTSVDWRVPGM